MCVGSAASHPENLPPDDVMNREHRWNMHQSRAHDLCNSSHLDTDQLLCQACNTRGTTPGLSVIYLKCVLILSLDPNVIIMPHSMCGPVCQGAGDTACQEFKPLHLQKCSDIHSTVSTVKQERHTISESEGQKHTGGLNKWALEGYGEIQPASLWVWRSLRDDQANSSERRGNTRSQH